MRNWTPGAEAMLDLVDRIYASAVEPARLGEALEALNGYIRGSAAQIYTRHRASGAVLDSQVNPGAPIDHEANEQYVLHWGARDPRAAALAALPSGAVRRCHELFDDKCVASNDFYQEFFIPHGFRWAMGGMFDSGDGTSTVVASVRALDAPRYEEWAADALRRVLPHFQRAAVIRRQLQSKLLATHALPEILRMAPSPSMLIDEYGRLLCGNDQVLAVLPELSMRLAGSYVQFLSADVQQRWRTAVHQVFADHLAKTMELTVPDGRSWKMHLVPYASLSQAPDSAEEKTLLVMFEKPTGELEERVREFAMQVDLTKAECEVLALLTRGMSAKAIARRRNGSANTARNQIMAILEKTGHHSQRELIATFNRPMP